MKVTVGYCTAGQIEVETHTSLRRTFAYDRTHGDVLDSDEIAVIGGPRLTQLRNNMVRTFLDRDSDYLWCVDTDMVWDEDALHRLLDVADPVKAPIVGGLCFGTSPAGGPLFPTIYDVVDGRFQCRMRWSRGELLECDGTGWAFILVHRSVLEGMADKFGREPDGALSLQPWFLEGQVGDTLVEGDLAFCARARSLGYPIHVHAGVGTAHKKVQFLDEAFFDHVLATHEAMSEVTR